MTINARGKTYGDALRLKDSFQQSNLFKDVNLASAMSRSICDLPLACLVR